MRKCVSFTEIALLPLAEDDELETGSPSPELVAQMKSGLYENLAAIDRNLANIKRNLAEIDRLTSTYPPSIH
jgi:hypothetical protein